MSANGNNPHSHWVAEKRPGGHVTLLRIDANGVPEVVAVGGKVEVELMLPKLNLDWEGWEDREMATARRALANG